MSALCHLYVAEGMTVLKPSTIRLNLGVLRNYVIPLLGRHRVIDVTRADVERLLARVVAGRVGRGREDSRGERGRRKPRGGKGAGRNAVIALSGALAFAVRRGIVPKNPARGVRKPTSRNGGRRLAPEEMARLGAALSAAEASGRVDPFRIAAIRLLCLTGCRRGEVLTLKWAYVDRPQRCLRLPDSKTGPKTIYIGEAALAVLDSLPKVEGNPYVLPGRGGVGHVSCIHDVWVKIRAASGLEHLRPHDLRHAFASRGIADGESLRVIGALLGHRSLASTAYYAHVPEHSMKGAADRISGEIARALVTGPGTAGAATSVLAREDELTAAAPGLVPLVGRAVVTRGLDAGAAAARAGFTPEMLLNWRAKRVGPPFRVERGRVVYDAAELDAWATSLRVGWTPAALVAMRLAEA